MVDEACNHYQRIKENLNKVEILYPWDNAASAEDVLPVDENGYIAVEALQEAKDPEEAGLQTLEMIIKHI